MIDPEHLFHVLGENGMVRFTGVPDSLLKDLCAYITDNVPAGAHVIAANEGNAIGLAAGWYLGTGAPAMVYMQNSGLGNAINPLASLSDPEVYGIPMLLVIGWRGEPGKKDEPQHVKQGRITPALLEAMEIPFKVLGPEADPAATVASLCAEMRVRSGPVALIVREGTFSPYKLKAAPVRSFQMDREGAIVKVAERLRCEDVVVSTTGKASRELCECRLRSGKGSECDFLTVGSMGHASSIAMGLAGARPERKVLCFDGDGAFIMHMGALAVIGQQAPENLVHLVFNNGSHDSVGGQPTAGLGMDMPAIARACGYRSAVSVSTDEELEKAVDLALREAGPSFIEVKVNGGARKDLGRPRTGPRENREALMANLGRGD
ncbi:MAG: phosphonopyruvate decarboxylase [Euryarchaeota archaeon]|nr:phosphonopyruvate decarboxylase [Euryarchaeota archaeon]